MEKPKDSKHQCEKPKAFNTRMVLKINNIEDRKRGFFMKILSSSIATY